MNVQSETFTVILTDNQCGCGLPQSMFCITIPLSIPILYAPQVKKVCQYYSPKGLMRLFNFNCLIGLKILAIRVVT